MDSRVTPKDCATLERRRKDHGATVIPMAKTTMFIVLPMDEEEM